MPLQDLSDLSDAFVDSQVLYYRSLLPRTARDKDTSLIQRLCEDYTTEQTKRRSK